jgi:hypothetical protein
MDEVIVPVYKYAPTCKSEAAYFLSPQNLQRFSIAWYFASCTFIFGKSIGQYLYFDGDQTINTPQRILQL